MTHWLIFVKVANSSKIMYDVDTITLIIIIMIIME